MPNNTFAALLFVVIFFVACSAEREAHPTVADNQAITDEPEYPSSEDGIVKVLLLTDGVRQPASRGPDGRVFRDGEYSVKKIVVPPKAWGVNDGRSIALFPDPGKVSGSEVYVYISKNRNWAFVKSSGKENGSQPID